MTWSKLVAKNRLKRHKTSPEEVASLIKLIERDLHDAAIPDLSADRRFATAYNAVLQLGKLLLACAGYRTSSSVGGHHKTTFEAVRFALNRDQHELIDYFETCRHLRNTLEYDYAEVASEDQVEELLAKAEKFKAVIIAGIKKRHSQLLG